MSFIIISIIKLCLHHSGIVQHRPDKGNYQIKFTYHLQLFELGFSQSGEIIREKYRDPRIILIHITVKRRQNLARLYRHLCLLHLLVINPFLTNLDHHQITYLPLLSADWCFKMKLDPLNYQIFLINFRAFSFCQHTFRTQLVHLLFSSVFKAKSSLFIF